MIMKVLIGTYCCVFYRLGKTIQVIAFLSGLFDAEEAKTIIIVMPLSLIENWRREFDKW